MESMLNMTNHNYSQTCKLHGFRLNNVGAFYVFLKLCGFYEYEGFEVYGNVLLEGQSFVDYIDEINVE